MKSLNLFILTCTFLIAPAAKALIFDNGSRRANVAEAPEHIRWAARSVVSVFSPSGFIQQPNGDYLVKKFQMNSVPNSPKTDALRMLCETEKYSREYRAESLKGSGILITPDQVLVPAHLYKRATDCKERKIVVNYTGRTDIVPHEDVYNCIKREYIRYDMYPEFRPEGHEFGTSKLDGHMDYAIIKLDRPVKDIEPARANDNPDLLKLNDRLYFVSSMRGLPQTVESAEIKFISPGVVSTNASTAQGSSGGIYFNDDGVFIGMHISSNPASNARDDESNCLRWVEESTETFDWDNLVFIKERGVERPMGALMLPTTTFHSKLFKLQKAYLEALALMAEQALEQEIQSAATGNPISSAPASSAQKAAATAAAAAHEAQMLSETVQKQTQEELQTSSSTPISHPTETVEPRAPVLSPFQGHNNSSSSSNNNNANSSSAPPSQGALQESTETASEKAQEKQPTPTTHKSQEGSSKDQEPTPAPPSSTEVKDSKPSPAVASPKAESQDSTTSPQGRSELKIN